MSFHPSYLKYNFNRELIELYASIGLRNFTIGLIAIFEPIYLFLYFGGDISKTLLYFGIINFLFGICSPFAGKIVTKIGIKHSMLLSVPFLFLYYVGLWNIESLGVFFPALVFLLVMNNLLYWPAFHIGFARFSDKKRRGRQLSHRHIIAALSAAASPVVGGIILVQTGYPTLFGIVLVLLFISTVPLFLSKEVHEHYTDSFQKAFREMFQKKFLNKTIAFLGEAGEDFAHLYVWPIFLYVLAVQYSSIGVITSVALFAGLAFALYLGRLIDKMGPARLLSIGSWLNAFTWPIKIFVATPASAFVVHTFHQFTRLLVLLPFGALFYDWVSREEVNRDRFTILREMVLNVGRGLMLFFFAGVFLFTDTIAIVFPVAGAFSLLLMFLARERRD